MKSVLIGVALPLVKWGLGILRNKLVAKLPDGQNKEDILTLFNRFEELIDKLTNDNPNNNEELGLLLRSVVGTDLLISLTVRRDMLVEEVEVTDERLAKTIDLFSQPILELPTVFTDDVTPNLPQIKAVFVDFAKNTEVHSLVLYDWIEPTLIGKGVNPVLVGTILRIIADAISGKLGKDGRKNTVPTIRALSNTDQEVVNYLYSRADALSAK